MRTAIKMAVGIGFVWWSGQAFAADEAAASAPDPQKEELQKQLAKVKADKGARRTALEATETLAKLKKADLDADDAMESVLKANPDYAVLRDKCSRAKKAWKKAQDDQMAEGVLSVVKKAYDDALAVRDAYLKDHPEVGAAIKAAEEAKDAANAALERAKDEDTEYSALRQKEDDLERKLEVLEKRAAEAPKAL